MRLTSSKLIRSITIVLVIFISGMLGWIVGVRTTVTKLASTSTEFSSTMEDVAEMKLILANLKYLRSGDSKKAIELLEKELDMHIIKYTLGIKGTEKERYYTELVLKRVKEYRSQYPRENKLPYKDNPVEDVLSKIDEN